MRVWIYRFRSLTEWSEDFSLPLNLLKGKSGKGKSTVFEAIKWCFYGNIRGIYPFGSEGNASRQTKVIIELPEYDGLILQRTQPPDHLTVRYKDVNIEGKEASAYIQSIFGSKLLWMSTSYITQGEICPLLTIPNTERMNLLRELVFGLEDDSPGNPEWCLAKVEAELEKTAQEIQKLTIEFDLLSVSYVEWDGPIYTEDQVQNLRTLIGQKTELLKVLRQEMLMYREMHGKRQALLNSIPENSRRTGYDFVEKIATAQRNIAQLKDENRRSTEINARRKFLQQSLPDDTATILQRRFSHSLSELHDCLQITIDNEKLYLKIQAERDLLIRSIDNRPRPTVVPDQELLLFAEEKIANLRQRINRQQDQEKLHHRLQIEDRRLRSQLATLCSDDPVELEDELRNFDAWTTFQHHQSSKPANGTLLSKEKRQYYQSQMMKYQERQKVCQHYGIDDVETRITEIEELLEAQIELPKLQTYQNLLVKIQTITSKKYPPRADVEQERRNVERQIGLSLTCPVCSSTLELIGNQLHSSHVKIPYDEGQRRLRELDHILSELVELEKYQAMLVPSTWKPSRNWEIISPDQCQQFRLIHKQLSSLPTIDENIDLVKQALQSDEQAQIYLQWAKDQPPTIDVIPTKTRDMIIEQLGIARQHSASRVHFNQSLDRITCELADLSMDTPSLDLEKELQVLEQQYTSDRQIFSLNEMYHRLETLPKIIIEQSSDELRLEISNYADQQRCQKIVDELNSLPNISVDTCNISQAEQNLSDLKELQRIELVLIQLESIPVVSISATKIETVEADLLDHQSQLQMGEKYLDYHQLATRLQLLQIKYQNQVERERHLTRIKFLIGETINLALQEKVDSINLSANLIAKELFDDDISIELRLTKELKTTKTSRSQVNLIIRHKGYLYEGITHLSGGEKDRLSLALTLALARTVESPLLMLDECIASLDAESRELCTKVVRQFASTKKVIFSCHEVVEGFFDQIVSL